MNTNGQNKVPFITALDYLKSKYKLNTDEFCDNVVISLQKYCDTTIKDSPYKSAFLNDKSAFADSSVSFHDVATERVIFHVNVEISVAPSASLHVNVEYLFNKDNTLGKMTWINIRLIDLFNSDYLLEQYQQDPNLASIVFSSDSVALNELLIIKRFAREWGKLRSTSPLIDMMSVMASKLKGQNVNTEENNSSSRKAMFAPRAVVVLANNVKNGLTTVDELKRCIGNAVDYWEKAYRQRLAIEELVSSFLNDPASFEKMRIQQIKGDDQQFLQFSHKLFDNHYFFINVTLSKEENKISRVDVFIQSHRRAITHIAYDNRSTLSAMTGNGSPFIKGFLKMMNWVELMSKPSSELNVKDIESYYNSSTSACTETPPLTRDKQVTPVSTEKQPEIYDWSAIQEACKGVKQEPVATPEKLPKAMDYISILPQVKFKPIDPKVLVEMRELAAAHVSKLAKISVDHNGLYQIIPTDKAVWPQVEIKGIHLKQSKPLDKIKEPIPETLTRLYQRSSTDSKESDVMQNNQNTVKEFLQREFTKGQLRSTDFKRSVYSALCGWYKHYGTLSAALVDSFLISDSSFENMTFAKCPPKPGDRENKPTYYFFRSTSNNGSHFDIKVVCSAEDFTIDQIVIDIKLPSDRPLNAYIWDAGVMVDFPENPPFPAAQGFLTTIAEIELSLPGPQEPADAAPSDKPVVDGSGIIGQHMPAIELLEKLNTITTCKSSKIPGAVSLDKKETKLDMKDTYLKIATALAVWSVNALEYQHRVAKPFSVNPNAFENMNATITEITEESISVSFNYCLRYDIYFNIDCEFTIKETYHTLTGVEVFITRGGERAEEVEYRTQVTVPNIITTYHNYFYKLGGAVTPEQVQRILDSENHTKLLSETKKRVEKQATEQLTQIQSTLLGVLVDNGFNYPKGIVDILKQAVVERNKPTWDNVIATLTAKAWEEIGASGDKPQSVNIPIGKTIIFKEGSSSADETSKNDWLRDAFALAPAGGFVNKLEDFFAFMDKAPEFKPKASDVLVRMEFSADVPKAVVSAIIDELNESVTRMKTKGIHIPKFEYTKPRDIKLDL